MTGLEISGCERVRRRAEEGLLGCEARDEGATNEGADCGAGAEALLLRSSTNDLLEGAE